MPENRPVVSRARGSYTGAYLLGGVLAALRVPRVLLAVVGLAAGVIAGGAGCASIPETSRTGAIHNIRIEEGPDPQHLFVKPGDEIRWVNARTLPVQIDLIAMDPQNLLCERGFSTRFGGLQESITLQPNGTASICFSTAASEVKYNVRMGSSLPGGRDIVAGVITVDATR
jgi:hypothetical protein